MVQSCICQANGVTQWCGTFTCVWARVSTLVAKLLAVQVSSNSLVSCIAHDKVCIIHGWLSQLVSSQFGYHRDKELTSFPDSQQPGNEVNTDSYLLTRHCGHICAQEVQHYEILVSSLWQFSHTSQTQQPPAWITFSITHDMRILKVIHTGSSLGDQWQL